MKIHCLYDALVKVDELKENPRNSNKHPDAQIERLSKILNYQGWRYAVKVSKRSGFITSGHGRLLAAKKLNLETVPVVYQEYETEDQENADIISDNSIASWAELDLSMINQQIGDFDGGSFDLELLGLKDFTINSFDSDIEIKEKEIDENIHTEKECPQCGYKW